MNAAVVVLAIVFVLVIALAGVLLFIVRRDRAADITNVSRRPITADLVELTGPNAGFRHRLRASDTVIGSDPTCDVVIANQGVSPRHAVVRAESGRYVVLDRKSQNGIWAAGRRIFAVGLEPGGQFQIGATVFALLLPDEPLPMAQDHLIRRSTPKPAEESFAVQGVGFERLQQIGFGGQVTVYRARSKSDGSDLVVKYLNDAPSHDGRQDFYQRFKQQIIIGLSIRHPHCVRILGGDPRSEAPYLIEEFVSGGTLRDKLTQGRIPFDDCVKIIGQTCDALQYLHGKGLIHRDIKPSNMLLDDAGNIKLTDFGLIRIAGSPRVTQIGMCLGTPHYMSVEQVRGESSRITPASDLYSLGIVAFEMFAGRLPFDGGGTENILNQHLKSRPPHPGSLDTRIPERISQAILRALEKDPARRFPDARAMAEAFGYTYAFDAGQSTAHITPKTAPLRLKRLDTNAELVIQHSPTVLTRALVNPADKLISREHGRAFVYDGLWRVAELAHKQTVNGLFVNGVRVDEEGDILQSGDEVRLGHTTLRVQ
jgi:serine/threonine protein kinase